MYYRKALFYYCALISTLLFVWILIYLPKPLSFIPLFLILPITFHFWLSIIKPRKIKSTGTLTDAPSSQGKSPFVVVGGFIMLTLFISTLSILLYSLSYQRYSQQVKPSQNTNSIEKELSGISKKLHTINTTNADLKRQINEFYQDLLINEEEKVKKVSTLDLINQSAKLASNSGLLKVTGSSIVKAHKNNTSTSPVLEVLEQNKIYTFSQKESGWYLITLDNLKEGWITSKYIQEL